MKDYLDDDQSAQNDAIAWQMMNDGLLSMKVVSNDIYVEITAKGKRAGLFTETQQ